MTELYPSNWLQYLDVAAIFFRLLGLFFAAPFFSHRSIPTIFKVLFALSFSLALYAVVKPALLPMEVSLGGLVTLVARETIVGLMMGFVATVTFEAIHLAAHFVGYQMGFGTVGLMDPQNSSQVSALVPLQALLALIVFWVSDMHHDVLQVFVLSFQATSKMHSLDLGGQGLYQFYVGITAKLFWLSIRLAAPFTLLVLCCQVALGILSRMLPQMNLLLFSFPLTILAGYSGLYLLAPEYLSYVDHILVESTSEMMALVKQI